MGVRYPTRKELNRLVLDHLFGLTTQQPIQEARRCSAQRASQIVGEVVWSTTSGRGPRRPAPAMVAFLLTQQDHWGSAGQDTPEYFYWVERNLSGRESL